MFTIIILIAVVIFSIGYLSSLTPTQRTITIRYTLNICTLGVVYIFRAGKEGSKIAFQGGRVAGNKMALGGMESFKDMATANNTTASEGGAVRIAIRKSQEHGAALGMSDVADNLKKLADADAKLVKEMEAELEAILKGL